MNNGTRKTDKQEVSVGDYVFLPVGSKDRLGSHWKKTTQDFLRNGKLVKRLYPLIKDYYAGIAFVAPQSNFNPNITTIAYGNNLWVAGAEGGQLRTSTDGTTWITRTSNFGSSIIRSVVYANGLWVAGGLYGQLRTSTKYLGYKFSQTTGFVLP